MEIAVTQEIAKILKELYTTGQFASFFLISSLILIVLITIWIIWFQRQIIKKLNLLSNSNNQRIKTVEALMKATSESQKMAHSSMKDQFDIVVRTNDELRKEIGRVDEKQEDFEKKVKESISIGFRDVKARLNQISVSELLNEIPEKFRKDLEKEINTTSERVIQHLTHRLKQAPDEMIDEKALLIVVEKTVHAVFHENMFPLNRKAREEFDYYMDRSGRIPPEFYTKYGFPPLNIFDEEMLVKLAKYIAYHIDERWTDKFAERFAYHIDKHWEESLAERIAHHLRRLRRYWR